MKNYQPNNAAIPSEEIDFGDKEYGEVCDSLREAIGESNYFSGKIETAHDGFCSTLTLSVIVYRDREHPEHPITNLVPIWWEMTTLDANSNPQPNNFSFRELLELKIEN